MILPGSTSQGLAAALAAATDHALATVDYETFPDGEQCVSIRDPPAALDHAVVVVATTSAAAHIEVLQLQDAAREAGADRVTTVLPYMGYARQDDVFEGGEPLSARAVARAISTGTDRVLTVDPHEPGVCDFFTVPCQALSAAGRLAEPLPEDLADPVFLSPDAGATDLAEAVRDAYGGGETDHFAKTRHSGSEVTVEPSDAAVAGRDVVLVDDIVATGSTMSGAIAALTGDAGAVHVACVHPVLAGNARTKLASAGVAAVYGTDTVESPVSSVSVAPVVAAALAD